MVTTTPSPGTDRPGAPPRVRDGSTRRPKPLAGSVHDSPTPKGRRPNNLKRNSGNPAGRQPFVPP